MEGRQPSLARLFSTTYVKSPGWPQVASQPERGRLTGPTFSPQTDPHRPKDLPASNRAPNGRRSISAVRQAVHRKPARSAGCACHGQGVIDVAVRMKQRRGLLTEPSPPPARSSRRRCDPGLRHSLTEEHGPVEDSLTVSPRSSLHESAGFLALVAERPPKVAVGFNPRSAIPPTLSSRSDDGILSARSAIHFIRAADPRFPSSLRDESFRCHRPPWVETHGYRQMSLRDGRRLCLLRRSESLDGDRLRGVARPDALEHFRG